MTPDTSDGPMFFGVEVPDDPFLHDDINRGRVTNLTVKGSHTHYRLDVPCQLGCPTARVPWVVSVILTSVQLMTIDGVPYTKFFWKKRLGRFVDYPDEYHPR